MLLKMSFLASILIILIIILRSILINRLPKIVFVLLWHIVILRLLIPFDLPLEYGIATPLFNTKNHGTSIKQPVTFYGTSSRILYWPAETAGTANTMPADKACNINLLALIWITGMATLFIIYILLYIKEHHIIKEALPVTEKQDNALRQIADIPLKVNLLTSDRIFTPLVAGIVHPVIIFPKFFMPDNTLYLKYIITHELTHIKRSDNLWKIIILCTLCIHWFNPLVWIMYILFNRDMEMSCDEKVLSVYGHGAKKDYALALINYAENQYKWQFFSNKFGKKPIQERIEAIMKYKKLTTSGAVCAAVLLCTAVTVFAKGNNAPDNNKQENIPVQEDISKMENLAKKSSQGATPSAIYRCYDGTDNDFRYFANTEEFKEYKKYGLSYNKKTGHIIYEGKIVGYFHDETSKNVFTHLTDEAGSIGLKVKRNKNNEITGFEKVQIPYILEPGNITEGNAVTITVAEDDAIETSEPENNSAKNNENTEYAYSSFSATSEDNANNSVTSSDCYATSTDSGDNHSILEDYVKYGINYNKSLDIWQYKGKNIAGLWDSGKMLYTDDSSSKNTTCLIISNGTIKEVTKKEFKKAFE
ncbi:MAG: M56 family metallopeptidase [Lachnospiraceae bacterium]